jgi:hypothetical protein
VRLLSSKYDPFLITNFTSLLAKTGPLFYYINTAQPTGLELARENIDSFMANQIVIPEMKLPPYQQVLLATGPFFLWSCIRSLKNHHQARTIQVLTEL